MAGSMHKVVYKYYIGCSACLKCTLKDLELCMCIQQFRDGIVYTFPFLLHSAGSEAHYYKSLRRTEVAKGIVSY